MNSITLNMLVVTVAANCLTSVFAQGTILFRNDERALVMRWSGINDNTLVPVGPHAGWVQLAFAPVGTPYAGYAFGSTEQEWLAVNAGWTLGATAPFVELGLFDGGSVRIDGIAPGADAEYVLFGWNNSAVPGVTNYFDAFPYIGVAGTAGPFVTRTGDAGAPVSLADSFSGGLVLVPTIIPEPPASALLLMGFVVVLLWGRGGPKAYKPGLPFGW